MTYIDYKTLQRTLKGSAHWFSEVMRSNSVKVAVKAGGQEEEAGQGQAERKK
jgi:hypothetical protein